MDRKMDLGFSFWKIKDIMKVILNKIFIMVKVKSLLKNINMKDNGKIIKKMVMEYMTIWMVNNIMVIFLKIFNMEKVN